MMMTRSAPSPSQLRSSFSQNGAQLGAKDDIWIVTPKIGVNYAKQWILIAPVCSDRQMKNALRFQEDQNVLGACCQKRHDPQRVCRYDRIMQLLCPALIVSEAPARPETHSTAWHSVTTRSKHNVCINIMLSQIGLSTRRR